MRKLTLLSVILMIALILTSCRPATPIQGPVATEAPAVTQPPTGEKVTLTIESWRNDDLQIWQDQIIPAFEAKYPNIHVEFTPSAPAEYNGVLNTKLEGGTAGDMITCRPFDASLALFDKGYLAPLNDLPGMENFGDVAKSAWITDDGSNVFCVPMASVIHGFFYNKDAFKEVGIEKEPETMGEFFADLQKIKDNGTYTPLAMGTADMWEAATMGFQNIGPNYWMGEEGRLALIAGTAKYTDQPYIDTWMQLADWATFMPEGFEAVKYPDSQVLFTSGKAAIYPTGSWEISLFEKDATFEMDVFKPPLPEAGQECYISDHTDIALGMNPATKNPEAVKTFLSWVASQEFAELYSNALPGFFTLSNESITLQDSIAQKFLSWRGECKSTIRNSYQILSRGEPNLENELWRVSAAVINGTMTPEQAGQEIQAGLDKWYKPAGAAAPPAAGEKVTLTIESWRNDDLQIWQDQIIPAFEAKYPNIHVEFTPSAPAEYNGVLNTKLEGGTAGDMITCRPFDASLALFDKGYLAPLNDLPGMENFGDVAKSAWITDDGSNVFCVPMASVIHGFFYNKDAFKEVGIEKEPETVDEFFADLQKIKDNGTYIPLAMGTADMWEAATMGFQNIGPNYWMGEEGRLALINGTAKYTDKPYIDTWMQLADWAPFMPEGFEAVKYPDSQVLFTAGRAAIYPTGSWEISLFEKDATFEMDVFKPPLPEAGQECYISDHTDIALGMNPATKNPEAAKTFLSWVASQEFAELYSNALPGFFTLSNQSITLQDPIAQKFLSWRGECKSTIRNSYQILSRGEPNLENELWRVSAAVINGTMTPEQAGQEIQTGLDSWYKPAPQ